MTSLAAQRDALVEALTVELPDGTQLTGYPSAPGVIALWDAWPVWDSSAWRNGCVQEHTWLVYVALPNGDLQSTTESADGLLEPVGEALWAVGQVTRAAPALWASDGQQGYPCVQITVTI